MIRRLLAFRPTEREIVATLMGAGVVERVTWCLLRPSSGASGEAFNVARALSEGRGFADAYRLGQGGTAHLLPFGPAMAGGVYATLGLRTPAAEAVLAAWSIGLAMAAYLLFYRVYRRLGLGQAAALGALAYGCLAPSYITQEAVDFRVWEGGLAVTLAAIFLDRLLATPSRPSASRLAGLGALAALAFFVNPAVGLGVMAAAVAFALQRFSLAQTAVAGTGAAVVLAVLVGGWAWRNERVLGSPVMLRSNGGLELALANYPGALAPGDALAKARARLFAIHPMPGDDAYRAMQAAGGEVAYSNELGARTKSWMIAHPAEVARLALRHLVQTFAPPPWSFHLFGPGTLVGIRSVFASLAGVLGLVGVLGRLQRPRGPWLIPALLIVVPALSFCLFQPVARYSYLIYIPCVFFAADAVAHVVAVLRERRPGRGYATPRAWRADQTAGR